MATTQPASTSAASSASQGAHRHRHRPHHARPSTEGIDSGDHSTLHGHAAPRQPRPQHQRKQHQRGGGKRGRGGGHDLVKEDTTQHNAASQMEEADEPPVSDPALPSTASTTTTSGTSSTSTTELSDGSSDDDEREACLTCCEPIEVHSLGQCNHNNICSVCCLRRRELYKDDQCWCKTRLPQVVFTRDPTKAFADFDLSKLHASTRLPGILFENEEDLRAALKLWEFSCKVCHSAGFRTINQLKRHIQDEHRLQFCPVCLEHRAAFAHEQPLFTRTELQRHLAGDPKSDDAHQRCEFCNRSFYNKEHLYKHLTEKHESCHICQQNGIMYVTASRVHLRVVAGLDLTSLHCRFQYFRDYTDLEAHFDKEHHLCHETECLEKKFVVFRTALDLHAHDVAVHLPNRNLSKEKKREASKLSLDLVFSDSPSRGMPTAPSGDRGDSNGPSRRGGGGRRGGRGARGGHRNDPHHSSSDEEHDSHHPVDASTSEPRTPDLGEVQSWPTLPGGEAAPSTSSAPPRRYAALRTEWSARSGGSASQGAGSELWPSLPAGAPKKATGKKNANSWARSVAPSSSSSRGLPPAPMFEDDPFSWMPPPPRAENYGGNYNHTARPLLGVWGGQPAVPAPSSSSASGKSKKGKQVLFRAG